MVKSLLSLFCFFLFLEGQYVTGQTSLSVSNAEAHPGKEVVISVSIMNDEAFNAFQFDLCFPAQLSWKPESGTLTERADGHSLEVDLVEPGRLRVVAYSLTLADFSGTEGMVFQASFVAGKEPGTCGLTIERATIGGAAGNILDQVNSGSFTLLAPKLVINPGILDFGEVPLGENRTRSLTLQNAGNEELQVSSFSFGDARFSSSDPQTFTIPAGESRTQALNFQSSTKGQVLSQFKVLSNQPGGEVVVQLKSLAFAVNEIHLGAAVGHSGQEVEIPVSLNNMEAFSGFQFSIPLPNVATFVKGSANLSSNRKTDHVITADTANQRLTVVAYSPSNTAFGAKDGQIMSFKLKLQGQGGYYALNPKDVIIADASGNNILSASYGTELRVSAPNISVSSNQIDFGKVSSLKEQTHDLVIHNYGDDELRIEALVFGDNHFSTAANCPIVIPSYGSETIAIHFAAADGLLHESFLRIRSNDVERDPINIQLRAESYFPNELQVMDAYCHGGTRDTVYVNLFNQLAVSGFQFDLEFPEGVSPVASAAFLSDRKVDHALATSDLGSGKIRCLCWSSSLVTFTGTDGVVLGIPVNISTDLTGAHPIFLSNTVISNEKGQGIESGFRNGTLNIGIDLSQVDYHIAEGKLMHTTTQMEYAMGDDNWKACADGTTLDVAFREGDLKVREANNASNLRVIASLTRPVGPVFQVDFKNETTVEPIPENVCYSTNASLEGELNWGTNQVVALTPGQDLYFRQKATAHELPSQIAKLSVPARPYKPNHSIDYFNEQTLNVVSVKEQYSFDGFVNDFREGTGTNLELIPGQNIWFRYPATESSFCSSNVMLEVNNRPAIPNFTVDYGKGTTAEIVNESVEYAKDAVFSKNYGVGIGQTVPLTMGTTYWFRVMASNEEVRFRSESFQLDVAPVPAAPQYNVDFLNELTFQVIPESVEYAEDAEFFQRVQRGIGAKIALVPGKDLWFRVAQTENGPSGEPYHLVVPKRTAAPVHFINYEREEIQEVVETAEQYSIDGFVDDIEEGTGEIVALVPGQDIWFRYPATESTFCSNKVKVEVPGRPVKPVFTVNYGKMETGEVVPENVEYAQDAAFSQNYGVGTGQAVPLTMGATYWFRVIASNEAGRFCSESYQLEVATIPAAPQYSIDYANEKTAQVISHSIEYAEDAEFTQNVQRGAGEKIALEPGKDLWFRVAQTENNQAGEAYQLIVPDRPAGPVHDIDYVGEHTLKVIGVAEQYSLDGFVDDIEEGTGEILALVPGQDVWFRYPATETSFSSSNVMLEVKNRPATPNFTVDYSTGTTAEVVDESVEYAQDAAFSQNYGVGAGQPIPLTKGTTYWFRVMASNEAGRFRSESYLLEVATVPAAPQFSIDYLNEQTNETISESIEYAENVEFTQNVQRGSGAAIALEPGKNLWFRVARTGNSGAGEKFQLTVPNRPEAPTIKEENDETDVFDWNWVEPFNKLEDYQFSLDGGVSWNVVSEKPLQIGAVSLAAGMIQVRLASHSALDNPCFVGISLASSIDYSVVTGIEELDSNISVYPNPVRNHLHIKVSGCRSIRLYLTDLQGKVLLDRKCSDDQLDIDVSHLQEGIYFLLMEQDGSRIIKKILKI